MKKNYVEKVLNDENSGSIQWYRKIWGLSDLEDKDVCDDEMGGYSVAKLKSLHAGDNFTDKIFTQIRTGVCCWLRGYVGFKGNNTMGRKPSSCPHCGEAEESVPHYWEECPRWVEERSKRGSTENTVNNPGLSKLYIARTMLQRRVEGLLT